MPPAIREFLINVAAGLVGDIRSPSGMIGWTITVVLCGWWAISWHRRERAAKKLGMASWYFIAPCLVVAALAIAAGAYGIGLRSGPVQVSNQPASEVQASPITKHTYLRVDAEALTKALRQMHDALGESVRDSTSLQSPFSPLWSPGQVTDPKSFKFPTTAWIDAVTRVRAFFSQLQDQMQAIARANSSYRKEYLDRFVEVAYPPQDFMDTLTQYLSFLNLLSTVDAANRGDAIVVLRGYHLKIFRDIKTQYDNRALALKQIDAQIIEIGKSTQ